MRIGWCKGRRKDQRRESWAGLEGGADQGHQDRPSRDSTRSVLPQNGCDLDESFWRLSRNLSVINGKGNRENMKGRPIHKIVSIDWL